jgi:hypothetical protein
LCVWYIWSTHLGTQLIRFLDCGTQLVRPLFPNADIASRGLGGDRQGPTSVYCVRNVVALGDAREGKWRGSWRMEWVASTLTRSQSVVYPALLTLMRTPRLPAVDWTDVYTSLARWIKTHVTASSITPHGLNDFNSEEYNHHPLLTLFLI